MARCLLGLTKMMWGAAILHATRIRNLIVRRGEAKCPADLMRDIKLSSQLVKYLLLVIPSSLGSGTEISANFNPRHWKESLWVTLKETLDTWCTYPDVEETALDEESTATRGSLRNSESL